MEILVCVKQVPTDMEAGLDPETNTIIREGIGCMVNPLDRLALEMAVQSKERSSGSIAVLSMGPQQAVSALRECLAAGADEAWLASDRLFGGADTLATSYVLAQAVLEIEKRRGISFDLVLCGKQAMDSDTAQVGAELAENLDLPQITGAIRFDQQGNEIVAERELEEYIDRIKAKTPCLLTIGSAPVIPRYPTMKSKILSMRAEVTILTAKDLEQADIGRLGMEGSPTRTKNIYAVPHRKETILLEGDAAETARKLAGLLLEKQSGQREQDKNGMYQKT